MADSTRLWLRVLDIDTRKKLRLNYGVTIPFMVGAYYVNGYLRDDDLTSADCIKYILQDICFADAEDNEIGIFNCTELYELVIQHLSTTRQKDEVERIHKENPCVARVIYLNKDVVGITSIDELAEWLWNRYNKPITAHCFSGHMRGAVHCS